MKYNINLEAHETHLLCKVIGDISIANILGIQYFIHNDPYYANILRLLFDFTEMNIVDKEAGKAVMKLAMRNIKYRPFVEPSKIAVVCPNDQIRLLSETFSGIIYSEDIFLNLYETSEEALKWLLEK